MKKRNMAAHKVVECLGVEECKFATKGDACAYEVSGHCMNLYAELEAHRRDAGALELTLSKERCDAYFAAIEEANK